MRSERVYCHYSCNQNCRFCTVRRPRDERQFAGTAAVLQRIQAVLARGVGEVVLTGGEPMLRSDLPQLVAAARQAGAEAVVIETNGTLLDLTRAAQLHNAGATLLRVHLPGWGEACDAVTQDPGGFARTIEGMRAAFAVGLPVELTTVLVRSTAATVATLPLQLAELGLASQVRGLHVAVPTQSADPTELLDYPHAAQLLAQLDETARQVELRLSLAADSGPPPCLLQNPTRLAHLYALSPGGGRGDQHQHLAACAECLVQDRCPGVRREYLARHGVPQVQPIRQDRLRRRLTRMASLDEQIRREFVQLNRYTDRRTGSPIEENLIRINFNCNQACAFCFVSTHLPAAGDAAVRAAIVQTAEAGRQVTLSGGEPTLHPQLLEYIALAREKSQAHPNRYGVGLQTNAVRLADLALAQAVVAHGVAWVQVSLHGSYAELAERMSEAPGTFAPQLQGIDNLHLQAGVYLTVNFVITQRNYHDLVDFVELCARRWPRAFLNISFVGASSDVVPKGEELVPRFAEVLPMLLQAIARAEQLSLDIGGFESMCGVPLCLVPPQHRQAMQSDIPAGYDQGEFVHPPACQSCALQGNCFGLRRGYLALYGDGELRPVPTAPKSAPKVVRLSETELLLRTRGKPARLVEVLGSQVPGQPLVFELYLETPCQQSCSFCQQPGRRKQLHHRTGELLRGQARRLGRSLVSSGVFAELVRSLALCEPPATVCLTGHDWAADPELPAMLHLLAAQPKLGVSLLGPGAALSEPAVLERVCALPNLQGVTLTLQSADPAHHDQQVGLAGAGAKVLRSIQCLQDRGVRLGINVVVTAAALAELPGLLDWALQQRLRLTLLGFVPDHGPLDLRPAIADWHSLRQVLAGVTGEKLQAIERLSRVPLCAVPESLRGRCDADRSRSTENWPSTCQSCAARSACAGVASDYLERFSAVGLQSLV